MDVRIISAEPKNDMIAVTVAIPGGDLYFFTVRTKAEMEAEVRRLIANLEARDQALAEIKPGPVKLPPEEPAPDAQNGTLEALREELAVLVQEEALGVSQPEVLAAKRAEYVAIRDSRDVKEVLAEATAKDDQLKELMDWSLNN
jgi:hypothetical protein